MPIYTTFKVTAYPINSAYLPRIEFVTDTDPQKAREKADELAKKIKAESLMTAKVDVTQCGTEILGSMHKFTRAYDELGKVVESFVEELLGPAFSVPSPFENGRFHAHPDRNLGGTYIIEGTWVSSGSANNPDGTWKYEILIYPDDPSENVVMLEWPGKGLTGEAPLDADAIKLEVTRMVKKAMAA